MCRCPQKRPGLLAALWILVVSLTFPIHTRAQVCQSNLDLGFTNLSGNINASANCDGIFRCYQPITYDVEYRVRPAGCDPAIEECTVRAVMPMDFRGNHNNTTSIGFADSPVKLRWTYPLGAFAGACGNAGARIQPIAVRPGSSAISGVVCPAVETFITCASPSVTISPIARRWSTPPSTSPRRQSPARSAHLHRRRTTAMIATASPRAPVRAVVRLRHSAAALAQAVPPPARARCGFTKRAASDDRISREAMSGTTVDTGLTPTANALFRMRIRTSCI